LLPPLRYADIEAFCAAHLPLPLDATLIVATPPFIRRHAAAIR